MAVQSPGFLGPFQRRRLAASSGVCAWSAGAHDPFDGLRLTTYGSLAAQRPASKLTLSPYAQSATTARKRTPAACACSISSNASRGLVRKAASLLPSGNREAGV